MTRKKTRRRKARRPMTALQRKYFGGGGGGAAKSKSSRRRRRRAATSYRTVRTSEPTMAARKRRRRRRSSSPSNTPARRVRRGSRSGLNRPGFVFAPLSVNGAVHLGIASASAVGAGVAAQTGLNKVLNAVDKDNKWQMRGTTYQRGLALIGAGVIGGGATTFVGSKVGGKGRSYVNSAGVGIGIGLVATGLATMLNAWKADKDAQARAAAAASQAAAANPSAGSPTGVAGLGRMNYSRQLTQGGSGGSVPVQGNRTVMIAGGQSYGSAN